MVGIEPVAPKMAAGLAIDQLRVDLNLFAHSANAAFKDVAYAKLTTDLLHIDRLALVGEGGAARDDKTVGNAAEIGRQIVCDRIGKIFLLRIVRQIGKGQDDYR